MDARTKLEIGRRLRRRRENAGYTRERLGELCSLSPRFIANIELGDSTFSLDSLMTICQVLSCSSDHLLFGAETSLGRYHFPYSPVRPPLRAGDQQDPPGHRGASHQIRDLSRRST